ncbi:MAG: tyrosine-type recombinase/integrase [Chitinophagaceae bacterium]|nr:tyrosine-type recombinase/integrase [Chitinophagaceae bacterium]
MIRLIRSIDNVKHKTMIMLGYGCGLRVSEITGLTTTDVDEDRRLLLISRGKGKKDRVVSLSPVMIVMIREYKRSINQRNIYLRGKKKGQSYSTRSLESIIKEAKKKLALVKAAVCICYVIVLPPT